MLTIGGREIYNGGCPYIIAEISANHDGSYERAVEIIHAAREAGADAVKIQTYTADSMTLDCDSEIFRIKGTIWNNLTLFELYRKACTPLAWHPKLKKVADENGIDFFSTPFDCHGVDFLDELSTPVFKVASFELVDIPLLEKIASKGKPVIMSTGMATLAEIADAVRALRQNGCGDLALLKCVSSYPAIPEEMNLRTIPHLAESFHCATGISDHSLDISVPVTAVALGACIIEKHLTLSRNDGGPDATFSLEPNEFKAMVNAVRIAHQALGKVSYEPTEGEEKSKALRRSLFVVKDVKSGEPLTHENVRSIRPGDGLSPKHLKDILGKTAVRDLKFGTPLGWHCISG